MVLFKRLEEYVNRFFTFRRFLTECASLLNSHCVIILRFNVNESHLKATKLGNDL
jgi:hypothetical protein